MIASIMKTVQTSVLAVSDNNPTVATVNMERWLYIETYLVIITSSIPCLRSLLRRKNKVMTGYGGSFELSRQAGGSHPFPLILGRPFHVHGDGESDAESILDRNPTDDTAKGLKIEKGMHVSVQ